MTDLKNNLEKIWKEEFEEYYFEKINKPTSYVTKEDIAERSYQYKDMLLSYMEAKNKARKEIKNLLELTETLNQIRDNLQDENRSLSQELQKTREQLDIAEKVIQFYSEGYVVDQADWDNDDDADCVNTWNLYTGKRARQYFKDKDKQGE